MKILTYVLAACAFCPRLLAMEPYMNTVTPTNIAASPWNVETAVAGETITFTIAGQRATGQDLSRARAVLVVKRDGGTLIDANLRNGGLNRNGKFRFVIAKDLIGGAHFRIYYSTATGGEMLSNFRLQEFADEAEKTTPNNRVERDSGKAAADGVLTGAVHP